MYYCLKGVDAEEIEPVRISLKHQRYEWKRRRWCNDKNEEYSQKLSADIVLNQLARIALCFVFSNTYSGGSREQNRNCNNPALLSPRRKLELLKNFFCVKYQVWWDYTERVKNMRTNFKPLISTNFVGSLSPY